LNLGGLELRLGTLYFWKLGVLAAVLAACLWIFRPFCKYLCPLGALYGLMNRVSLCRLHLDDDRCLGCGRCAKACPMQVDPIRQPDSPECIRCGRCAKACPAEALHVGFKK